MKQKYLVILLVILANQLFGQNKLLLGGIKFNDSMKLIGMYPHYDKSKTFEKYNFIIEDLKILDSLKKVVKVGKPAQRIFDQSDFSIKLVDGSNNIIRSWMVMPNLSTININGDFFEFDINTIANLAKKFPLSYTFYEKEVKTEKAFSQFRDTLLRDKNFLFFYKSKLVFEGHFSLEFERNKRFSSPKAISDLEPTLDKLATKGKYNLIYELNDYNMNNSNQYSMTIFCSYAVYKAFNDKNGKKKGWQKDINNAIIFMKK